jgi:phenylacetyl-CoA:acceptor oxidoreductase 27-kDa subunit
MNATTPDNRRWAMVIDIRRCMGCGACPLVCGQQNMTPAKFWRKVEELGIDEQGLRQRFFLPVSCMHCENPSCAEVCPTGATFRRNDGIVDIDPERCIGCSYCILACPYQARTIYYDHLDFEIKGLPPRNRNGTCTKCTFCKERIDQGLARGQQPGIDAEATPACVVNCSSGALHFGDLNDPESCVSRLIQENRTMRINQGSGNEPAVYYIVP